MWVSVVTIEADEDPGYELVTVLRERFGTNVRTQTKTGWLHEAERAPIPPMGTVSPNQGHIRHARLRKSER